MQHLLLPLGENLFNLVYLAIGKPRSLFIAMGASDSIEQSLQCRQKWTWFSTAGLNHGLVIHKDYIFSSSDTTVSSWCWNGIRGRVVNNVNADRRLKIVGHPEDSRRTLWSLIRRPDCIFSLVLAPMWTWIRSTGPFHLYHGSVDLPLDFQTRQVFANGPQNEGHWPWIPLCFAGSQKWIRLTELDRPRWATLSFSNNLLELEQKFM